MRMDEGTYIYVMGHNMNALRRCVEFSVSLGIID